MEKIFTWAIYERLLKTMNFVFFKCQYFENNSKIYSNTCKNQECQSAS